jgi:hypothetical protein
MPGQCRRGRAGFTPVYSVDTQSYHISELTISGTAPGWILQHAADLSADCVIRVSGEQLVEILAARSADSSCCRRKMD